MQFHKTSNEGSDLNNLIIFISDEFIVYECIILRHLGYNYCLEQGRTCNISSSLLILEQHYNRQIRFKGDVYSLYQVYASLYKKLGCFNLFWVKNGQTQMLG